jgi:hypothetical protein
MCMMSEPLRSPDDEALHVDGAPDVLSLFWVENVAILAWHKPATAAAVEGLYALSKPQRERYPSGMSFIHVGRAQLSLMDAQARDVFVRVSRELGGYIVASAFVTHASGFMASTLRSVVTGVLVLSRTSHEIQIHERGEEVLAWLPAKHAKATGVTLDEDQLRRTLAKAETLAFGE